MPAIINKIFRVAVISNLDNHFHRTIATGLSKQSGEFSDNPFFKVAMLNLDFTEASVRDRLQWCVQQRIDFIIVVGTFFSAVVHRLMPSIGHIPYIFLGVRDPMALGLVDNLENPMTGVTGVIRQAPDPLHIARCLALLQPHVSAVLLPYYPKGACGQLSEQALKIEQYFATRGITTTLWPVNSVEELKKGFEAQMAKADTLLFLEGCMVSCYLQDAARFCWEQDKIFCYGESSDAIRFGAACAYGSKFGPFITAAIKIVNDYFNPH